MLSDTLSAALSDQVNAEVYSAYLYLAMSAHADQKGYKGFSNWLYIQYQEEMAHGIHMYQHILERGGIPCFADIKAPVSDYSSFIELFSKILKHEQGVSEQINKIASIAMQEKDHATYGFIQWYVNEQIEEEANAGHIVQKINIIGNNVGCMLDFDAELGTRVFIDPFPVSKK